MFTSQAGHRYFIQVRGSMCQDVPYTLQLAPAKDLTSQLQDTDECAEAKRAAISARRRLVAMRSAARRARGSRRARLRRAAALQQQQVTVADAAARTICERRPLTGYPFAQPIARLGRAPE